MPHVRNAKPLITADKLDSSQVKAGNAVNALQKWADIQSIFGLGPARA
jgi:hypothetical protein